MPLLLPEFNADHVRLVETQRKNRGWSSGALVTMSNCTSVPVVAALGPLLEFGVERVHVVSMQALSGAGYPGVASFDIADNVVPVHRRREEEKLETEPRKMLGQLNGAGVEFAPMILSASCNRVGVLDGHTVSVSVGFTRKPSLETIRELWERFEGHEMARGLPSAPRQVIYYNPAIDRPQPRLDRDAGRGHEHDHRAAAALRAAGREIHGAFAQYDSRRGGRRNLQRGAVAAQGYIPVQPIRTPAPVAVSPTAVD